MNKMNNKGQTDLRNIFIALLLVSAAGFGMFTFLNQGLTANYETPELEEETQFKTFQEQGNKTGSALQTIEDTLSSGESSTIDIIRVMVTRGFGALIELLTTPIAIATTVINTAFEVLGIPSYLKTTASLILLAVVIFGILALIMRTSA